jgi:hypothetical protein
MMTKENSKSFRKTAIFVGVFYIIGTVFGILSLSFTDAIRSAEKYLMAATANGNQIILGALSILAMGLALAMVPILMFPILRKQDEGLALGYVVFRGGLEAATYLAMAVSWFLLLPLSQVYIQAGTESAAVYQALGKIMFEAEELGTVLTIVFCFGGFMFYTLLYQSRLVPRWLSGWGLIALIPYFASGLLATFAILNTLSTSQVVLQLPLAIQEMVLALWLIFKGFNSAEITTYQSNCKEIRPQFVGTSRQ